MLSLPTSRCAVAPTQPVGIAWNLTIQLHCLVSDGAYPCGADVALIFVEASARLVETSLHGLRGKPSCRANVGPSVAVARAPLPHPSGIPSPWG